MIEYLEHLLDDGLNDKALAYAEQLLVSGDNSPKDMVAIHRAVLRARLDLTHYSAAVVAGEIAVRLAKEIEEWDYFGVACMDLGVAYYYLRSWDQAIQSWLNFLTALPYYRKYAKFEANIRYNLGLAQSAKGDFATACETMEQALSAANRLGDDTLANGIRLALAGALLKAGNLLPIGRLLAQCERYIRAHAESSDLQDTTLWNIRIRIEYALATDRLLLARRLGLRVLGQPAVRSDQQFSFHMMLARVALRRGCDPEALGHSLSARIHAVRCHRPDLESEADDFIYQFTTEQSGLVDTLDRYLLDSVLPTQEELDSPK